MSTRFPLFLIIAMAAYGPAAAADTTSMCLDQSGTGDAQCQCATDALAEKIGKEDADAYNAVGVLYLDGKANGQEEEAAWEAAIETAGQNDTDQADLLERMNAAREAHEEAIETCE
ncbi:hypothetical protein A3731_06505 [Roseovarius sp. HI0049]|nr:hypothetical protein A3731_33255 [Roseovarius sp. HI0049]KZY48611.1 hypothetical protein A3731_06505 [Roseovarius sp. HI0049]